MSTARRRVERAAALAPRAPEGSHARFLQCQRAGRLAQASGKAHRWTVEEAKDASAKGNQVRWGTAQEARIDG